MRHGGLRSGAALVWVLGLVPCAYGEEWAASDPQVRQAIESFQPFWTPPERELRGWRVIISPAGGQSVTREARDRDDLCLWTASHLYHLVRNAGGFPSLDRPDDRAATQPATPGGGRAGRVLLVQVLTGPNDRVAARAASGSDESVQLARALVAAGLQPATQENTLGSSEPSAAVLLPAATDPRRAVIEGIPAHRSWAERIYRGLAAFVTSRPRSDDSQAEAGELDSEPPVVPFYPRHAPTTPARRTASAIWPEGNLPAAKARWFCDLYVRQAFSDRTNVYFEHDVRVDGDTVVIGGATSHTAVLLTLENALKAVGLTNVRSDMRLLPEQGRLDADRWFGVCIAPMALTFGKPVEGGPLQSQSLYGEPMFLLDRQDGFYLVQGGGDGYVGWIRENCILPMSREAFKAYTDAPEVVLLRDVGLDKGRVVRGSRLRVAAAAAGTLELALPDGTTARISSADGRLIGGEAERKARAKAALDLLNVPYLFAGRSSVGLDCSGLVGTMCDQFGCVLPRDAAQQFVTGSLVATRWFPEGLKPGDRIYFLNEVGKIFHTGLSLGGDYFVHSSPPGVQISSLKEGHRLYREHWDVHFLGARR